MDANDQPFTQTATVVDISRHGARLEGIHCLKGPGEIIGVQCGKNKARFKVIWVGYPGSGYHGQAGLECLDRERYIWGQPPPDWEPDTFEEAAAAPVPAETEPAVSGGPPEAERRADKRFACSGEIKVWDQRGSAENALTGVLSDISEGGCYVQTMTPMAPGTQVRGELRIGGQVLPVEGQVRTRHSGIGMGMRFGNLTPETAAAIRDIIARLEAGASGTGYASLALERNAARQEASPLAVLIELLEEKGVLQPGEFRRALNRRTR